MGRRSTHDIFVIVVKIVDSKLARSLCSMGLRLIVSMSSVCVHRVSHWLFVTYSATEDR